jgi:ABC-type sugar transport system substrate-binding protein
VEARKMVEAGQMTATVAQNPADIGATGLKMMVDAKTGKVIPLDNTGIQAGGFNSGHRNNFQRPDASLLSLP